MSKDDNIIIDDRRFYFMWFNSEDVTLFSRLKLALSLILTPITLPLMGRSIKVRCERKKNARN